MFASGMRILRASRMHSLVQVPLVAVLIFILTFGSFAPITFAATGAPRILSYQGRLMDSSGTLLGGAGTNYCFKFSMYDAATVGSGSKLWPSGSPSTMTAVVKTGVFNVGIGDTGAGGDVLDYNFQDNDSVYLNVEVASRVGPTCASGDGAETYETLSPRHRILSSGFAINANTLGGFAPAQEATGNQIPVLSAGKLVLGNVAAVISATSTNTLTLQGGGATGDLQFFGSANKITAGGAMSIAGAMLANAIASITSIVVGGTSTTTIQGSTTGTSTLQGFVDVLGTNSTSTFAGGLLARDLAAYRASFGATATTTIDAAGNVAVGGGLSVVGSASFTYASSTGISSAYASSTRGFFGSLSIGSLTGLLKSTAGQVATAVAGTDYVATTTGDWVGTFGGLASAYYLDARNQTNFGVPFYSFFSGTTTDALAEGAANKYFSVNRVAGVLAGTTTDALAEGATNKYYTDARATNNFAGNLAATTTTALAEGANLYFTAGRANTNFSQNLAATTTDALAQGVANKYYSSLLFASDLAATTTTALIEGSNLYFTAGRATANFINNLAATTSVDSITTLNNLSITNSQVSDFTTGINSYVAASTTIAKTYVSNVFTGVQSFSIASTTNLFLSGTPSTLLKTLATGQIAAAVAGVDYLTGANIFAYPFINNATTTLLAFNGGLISNASSSISSLSVVNGTTTNATSTNLAVTNTITGSISGNAGTVTNGVYTTTFNGLFDSRLSATTSLPNITTLANLSLAAAQVTGLGQSFYGFFSATTTDALAEGTGNLYFTQPRATANFIANLVATTSVASITTLPSLALPATQLTGFGIPFYQFFSATTTDALAQGATNKYYSDTFVNTYINASTTIPKTYAANTFTNTNTFNGQTNLGYASTTAISGTTSQFTTASSTNLFVSGTPSTLLKTLSTGQIAAAVAGVDYLVSTFSYPFINNATTTLLAFNGGFTTTNATSTNFFAGRSTANTLAVGGTATTTIDAAGNLVVAGGTTLVQATSSTFFSAAGAFLNGDIGVLRATTSASLASTTAFGQFITGSVIATSTATSSFNGPLSVGTQRGSALVSFLGSISSATPGVGTSILNVTNNSSSLSSGTNVLRLNIGSGASACTAGTTCPRFVEFFRGVTTGDTGGTGVGRINIATGGAGVTYGTGAADLAEYMVLNSSAAAGDLVSLNASGVYQKAVAGQSLIGTISTAPGFVGNTALEGTANAYTVGFAGVIPTTVSTENGAISAGDLVTAGATPGVGVKLTTSGYALGQALQSYSGGGTGTINVLVSPKYVDASVALASYGGSGGGDSGYWSLATSTGSVTLASSTYSLVITAKTVLGNATSTNFFAGILSGNSAAFGGTGTTTISNTGALTTPSLTVGSLTGILKASAGAVSTGLVSLASDISGVLSISNGGTGTSTTPTYGKLLIGNAVGGYDMIATSSLGINSGVWGAITGNIADQADLQSVLATKLSLSAWYSTTTDALTEGLTNLYFTNTRANANFAGNLAATTTTALAEGNNLYFTSPRATANFIQNLSATTSVASITTLPNLSISNSQISDFATGINSYISGSTTIPKTYTSNAFNASQAFNGGLSVGTLNGPLQANNGVVSATTSIGVGYGGTGLTSVAAAGILLGNYAGTGYQQISTSSLGLLTTNVTEGSNLYFTQPRATANFIANLVATTSVASITTLPSLALPATQLTGFGIPFYQFFSATTTDALAQGSTNKYYSDTFVNTYINASTTIAKTYGTNTFTGTNTFNGQTNLGYASSTGISSAYASSTQGFFGSLSIGSLTGILKATAGAISNSLVSLTTDVTGILPVGNGGTGWANVAPGALVYGNGSGALATTTAGTAGQVLALLNGVPTWTASTTFSNGLAYLNGNVTFSAPTGSSLSIPYASSTMITATTASTTNLFISGVEGTLLKTLASGQVAAAVAGVDYLTAATSFGYLFPNNATTTGLGIYASSTIGNGTQQGGLTISGGATTTGSAYVAGNLGVGTTSPGSIFAVGGVANFTTATTTLYGTGGVNISDGCFAVDGTCIGGASSGTNVVLTAVRYYTSTQTWSKPSNLVYAVVEVWGGGGGGGDGDGAGDGTSGGGAGGYAMKVLTSSALTATTTIQAVVGAGGATTTSANGGSGGSSNFGGMATSTGGGPGVRANGAETAGGVGGVGSGGDMNLNGEPGQIGETTSTSQQGNGGSAPRGGNGGLGGNQTTGNGQVGGACGGGGGGAGGAAGGGGTGCVVVYEYTANNITAGNGSVNAGTIGQFAFYNSDGNTVSATSRLFMDTTTNFIGIGSTTPSTDFSVNGSAFFNGSITSTNMTATGTVAFTGQTNLTYASSTMISGTTASSTNLFISGTPSTLLKTLATGQVAAAVAGVDYLTSTFAYPFIGNATTTLLAFNGGLISNASSSISSLSVGNSTTTNATTTNLAVTNTITGSISGNAGTVTNGVYTTTFNDLFDNRLSATTSLPNLTTLTNLSIAASQVTGLGQSFYQYFSATTTNALTEGSSNLYFTGARATANFIQNLAATTSVASITALPNLAITNSQISDFSNGINSYINGSTTIPKVYTANIFTGTNTFSGQTNLGYASSTGISTSYASSTSGYIGTLSIGALTGLLKGTTGLVSSAAAGTDYVAPATTISAGAGLSGGGDLSTNRTISLNLANANVWTGLQVFGNASSTLFSVTGKAYFGGTATTTIDSAGNLLTQNATSTNLYSGRTMANTASFGTSASTSIDALGNTAVGGTLGVTGVATLNNLLVNSSSTIQNFSSTNATSTNATTSLLYVSSSVRGAGLSACSNTTDKLLWNSTTGQFTCGTDAGAGTGISSIGAVGQLQNGTTQTLATSTDTNLGLTIVSSGNIHTFTTIWNGILSAARGGTGWGTIAAGTLLTGNGSGAVATTTIGSSLQIAGSALSLNLANANVWTGLQTFGNASTTILESITHITQAIISTSTNALVLKTNFTSTAGLTIGSTSTPQMMSFDTVNSRVKVGIGGGTPVVLVVDTKNTPGDPSGVDGAMYYNSNTGLYRCYAGTAWRTCGGQAASSTGDVQFANADGSFAATTNFNFNLATNGLTLKTVAGQTADPFSIASTTATGSQIFSINTQGVLELSTTTDPIAPTSGLNIYAKDIAGRVLPKWIGPGGVDTPFQANLGFNRVSYMMPAGGATATTFVAGIGSTFTNVVTTANNPPPASTNFLTTTRRATFSTSATANTITSHRQSTLQVFRGNSSNVGGFFYTIRFGTSVTAAGNRVFVGLSDSVAAPANLDPLATGTGIGRVGVAINANTGNWSFVHNVSGTAPAVTNLGTGFPVDNTSLYELILFAKPNDTVIHYRVKNLATGAETSGQTLTTNIPTNTTFLAPQFWMVNVAASIVTFDFGGWYLESDQ